MTLGSLAPASRMNKKKKARKKAFTIYFGFLWLGILPMWYISSFNSYYQNSKNQEQNRNQVVAETGEAVLLCAVHAFPGSWLAGNTV